jgi:beta-lactamase regulating signal transducer with metallopeptidase domain
MNSVLWWVVQNTLTVAALIPVVWLACRLLRTRPAAQHLLWLLLMVKLVAPPVIDWPWELGNQWQAATAPPPVIDSTPLPTIVADSAAIDWNPSLEDELFALEAIDSYDATMVDAASTAIVLDAPPQGNTERYLFIAWALGAATIVTCVARGLFVQRRVLRNSRVPSRQLTDALQLAAERLRMRAPRAAVSNRVESPVVACLPRPRLIWPEALDEPRAIAASDGILAHELAHIARRDHWIVCLETLILACQWWNPLAWYLRRRLRETRELACDALALAHAGQSRGDYARRLLALSVGRESPLTLAPAFGARSFSRRFLQRRLTMIFDSQTHGRVSRGGALAAVLLAAVALPGFARAFQADSAPVATTDRLTTTSSADAPPAPDRAGAASNATSSDAAPATAAVNATINEYAPATATITTSADVAPITTTISDAVPARAEWVNKVNNSNLKLDWVANVATDPTQPATAVVIGRGDNAHHTMLLQQGAKLELFQTDDKYLRVTVNKADGTSEEYAFKLKQENADGNGAKTYAPVANWTELTRTRSADAAPATANYRTTAVNAVPATAVVSYAAGSADIEMLQSDVELAEITLDEKKMELEIAEQLTSGAFGGASRETIGKVQLAKIGLRRAEVELKRCKMKLYRAQAGSSDRVEK